MYVCLYMKKQLSVIKIKLTSRHIHEKLLKAENVSERQPARLLKTDSESWKYDCLHSTKRPAVLTRNLMLA